jgi:hypothetical protein
VTADASGRIYVLDPGAKAKVVRIFEKKEDAARDE